MDDKKYLKCETALSNPHDIDNIIENLTHQTHIPEHKHFINSNYVGVETRHKFGANCALNIYISITSLSLSMAFLALTDLAYFELSNRLVKSEFKI